MIFQKILVPLDGSEHSKRALESAIQIAKKLNSKLALLTVYSASGVAAPGPELSIIGIEAARNFGKKIWQKPNRK